MHDSKSVCVVSKQRGLKATFASATSEAVGSVLLERCTCVGGVYVALIVLQHSGSSTALQAATDSSLSLSQVFRTQSRHIVIAVVVSSLFSGSDLSISSSLHLSISRKATFPNPPKRGGKRGGRQTCAPARRNKYTPSWDSLHVLRCRSQPFLLRVVAYSM